MINNKKLIGIVLTLIITIVGFYIIRFFNPHSERIEFLRREIPNYKLIQEKDTLNYSIVDFFHERGFTYIEFEKGEKIAFGPARNGLYKQNFIGDFIQVGDFVKKRVGSDTLFIERNEKEYFFILGEIINEE